MKRVLFKKDYFTLLILLCLPMVTFAQGGVFDILELVAKFIGGLIPIIIGIAVLMFLYGVSKYVTANDADDKKAANSTMLYGIVVLFVMVSIWGLVGLLGDTFDLPDNVPDVPGIPGFN